MTNKKSYTTMKKTILTAAILLAATGAYAENDDAGLWLSAGVEKKIYKKLEVDLSADFRTRNDFKTVDRWGADIGASYKLTKWLKADAGYSLLYYNRQEKLTTHTAADGSFLSYNNWRPGYWSVAHRLNASLTGSMKFGNIGISLRERWQYTSRPAKTTERYDFDNLQWEETTVGSKDKHLLRSRLQVEYDRKKATFKPYANAELFNAMALEKVRVTVGTDIKLTKHHTFDIFYRCQFTNDKESDNEPNCHYIGAGYTYKF